MEEKGLYQRSNIRRLAELGKLTPETFRAFLNFDRMALGEGLLSRRTKELIAIAVAHVTGCPYCIDGHVAAAKKLEVSKDEIVEAVMVATALKAGSAFAHGFIALSSYDQSTEGDLYARSNTNKRNELKELHPDAVEAFAKFDIQASKAGHLSRKEKELISIAVAHVTGCAYCIDAHSKKGKQLGISREEMAESIFVATALKAGSALAHSVNALNAYDEI
ncbi:carboxymuconolactone decarboxylase family protein [Bacillus sp. JJ1521]|uniref:carboxymuconolactone decarboxylase family protein n=1 Tax=Bacillus sp. JJ1521 TaxID=3122957 RepID=UPI003000DEC6